MYFILRINHTIENNTDRNSKKKSKQKYIKRNIT